jgi:hypothetical protein
VPISIKEETSSEYTYKYMLDGTETTDKSQVESLGQICVTFEQNPNSAVPVMVLNGFTTEQGYYAFGDAKSIPLRKMDTHAKRMAFVADSAGLTTTAAIPSWYEALDQQLSQELDATSTNTSIFGVRFYDFWNSNTPSVFIAGPVVSRPMMPYTPLINWNNRVSAVKPECFAGSAVTLYDLPFYKGMKVTFFTPSGPLGPSSKYHFDGTGIDNTAGSFRYGCFQNTYLRFLKLLLTCSTSKYSLITLQT